MGYFGGKSRMAPWIVSLMPAHRVYVEPFCGSAAVLFAKPRSTHEIINDADGGVVNFMRCLREHPVELERLCRLTPYARDEYVASADVDEPADDPLERARRWWVMSSQSFGQMAKVGTGWSTSIERGSNNARSIWNRLGLFAPAGGRLGPVTIENRHAFEVIERYSAADGVLYCDPPYVGSTRSSIASGRRPGGDYAVEFHTEHEHRQLAEVLRASPATVLLSGYPSALYEDLYDGWSRLQRTVLRRSSNGRSSRERHDGTRRRLPRGRVSGRARPDEPLATWCEAQVDGVCTGRAEHRHHVRRRSQGGGDDASNTRDLCGRCHEHVHRNPEWAYEAGLLERSHAIGPMEAS